MKRIIDGLRKIGPFSKHILNYSYPPLLYQRGEDDDDEDEESQDQGECDDDEQDSSNYSQDKEGDGMGQLPEFKDSDEDELIALEGAIDLPQNKKSSEPSLMDGDDNNGDVQDFLKQLKAVEDDKDIDQTGENGYY